MKASGTSSAPPARQPRPLAVGLLVLLTFGSWGWRQAWAAEASPPAASSQEETRALGEKGSPRTTGPIVTDTTIPQAPGTGTLFIPTFLAFTGGTFNSNWRRVSAGGDFKSLSAQAQLFYGVAPRTEVYVIVPYLHNWAGNVNQPPATRQKDADFGGLANLSVTGKYLLFKEQPSLPAVAGILTLAFPTGHHDHLNPGNLGTDLLGRGAYEVTPGLNFFKYAKPFLLYANLWYTMSSAATVNGARRYYPDRITLNLAAEYPLPWKRLVFLLESVNQYDGGRIIGHRANQPPAALMSLLPALEFLAGDNWSFVAGVLVDLGGKNTRYNYSPNFSIFYTF